MSLFHRRWEGASQKRSDLLVALRPTFACRAMPTLQPLVCPPDVKRAFLFFQHIRLALRQFSIIKFLQLRPLRGYLLQKLRKVLLRLRLDCFHAIRIRRFWQRFDQCVQTEAIPELERSLV